MNQNFHFSNLPSFTESNDSNETVTFYTDETYAHFSTIHSDIPEDSNEMEGRYAKDTKCKTILIVDDDKVNIMVLQRLLAKHTFHILTAKNGKEAVEQYKNHYVDLIFMDLQMPVMDGFQATQIIRTQEADQSIHTPIIAVTAYSNKEIEAMEAGMDYYLEKPVSYVSVIEQVKKHLEQP